MGAHRAPLVSYAPASASAKAYGALWDEITDRLS